MRKYHDTEEFLTEEKYLYLLLYAPGHTKKTNEPIRGNTWLQKIMHTTTELFPITNYEFDKYYFGVFSASLKTIQIQNYASGIIDQHNGSGPLQLSSRGMKIAKQMWNEITDDEKQSISGIKKFFNDMKYWELISYSYSTYPETVSQSEIKPEFQKNRVLAAVNLFKRKKISLKKAASIAGKTMDEFEQILLKKRIKPYELNKERYIKSIELIENIT